MSDAKALSHEPTSTSSRSDLEGPIAGHSGVREGDTPTVPEPNVDLPIKRPDKRPRRAPLAEERPRRRAPEGDTATVPVDPNDPPIKRPGSGDKPIPEKGPGAVRGKGR